MSDNQKLFGRIDRLERQVAELIAERDARRRLEMEDEMAWDQAFPSQSLNRHRQEWSAGNQLHRE
ncbi:hypothetical protein SAMN05192583_3141 [Sphingomonas gellani]|uniref:Uncharacterized protein n=1 Tax=Sphingomonas gellani TaxID=1166340 RepID=A0A1H8HX14_9SPHN|nr:hypothetical protein [Sphingomonas gellani]SEN60960.1 hypothetical protein SAMN05192583_3141 [Sphingomonas gellani]